MQLWKMPAAGGQPVQIGKGGGADGLESPDGRFVHYTKVAENGPGLWSIPIDGGEEVRLLDSVWFGYWAVAQNGIYFIDFNVATGARRPVKLFNFQSREVTEIGTVETSVSLANNPGFAVIPDSRWLLYSSLESTDADRINGGQFSLADGAGRQAGALTLPRARAWNSRWIRGLSTDRRLSSRRSQTVIRFQLANVRVTTESKDLPRVDLGRGEVHNAVRHSLSA